MTYTTLNEIHAFNPRQTIWETLLAHLGKTAADDEPLPLVTVLDSAGLDATIWCLRVRPDIAAKFARWCADRAAWATDRADRADRADWADWADWAAWADRADWADWAAWAAAWAAGAAERQAQTDKLRELLS